jgi:hypothetical protein
MANDNTVNVEITASVAGLKSGLSQAEKGIKGFGTSTDKMTSKTNKMAGAVKANAVPSLTAFSQVIQDAPYGIRGVANNITQLTSQFGYLSKSSGGAGNALKAMIGSLTGPAGILLAVSLVTSLLVSYGDELANIGSASGKAAEKQKDLAESLGFVSDTLSAQVKALDSQIKLLEAQKLPTKELLADKLNLLETELQTNVERRAALSLQLNALKAAGVQLTIAEKIANALNVGRGGGVLFFEGLDKEESDNIQKLETDIANLGKTIADTSLLIGKLRNPKIFGSDGEDAPKPDDIARPTVEAIQASKAIVDATATGYFTNWKNTLLGTLGTAKNELAPITTAVSSQIENAIPTTTISEKAQQLKDIFSQLGEDIKGVTQSGIYETIANMSFALGDALGSGGNALKAVGQAMLGTLGDILIKFGELSLAAGIAATALGQALKNPLNPANAAAAIAAGAALIAIGGAVKAFSSSIGGKSASESDTGSYSGSSSSNYSSGTSYASSSGGGGTYVFEIAGTKLIGVLKNTLDRNKQLGGSNNLIFG